MNNFYAPSLSGNSEVVELTGDEARHIGGSRRLKPTNKVTLFNGCGLVGKGTIESLSAKSIRIKIDKIDQLQEPERRLVLASAVPKGDRLNTLLDMATQLGMSDFIPLKCQYSVVTDISNKIDRLKRVCVSACKQSGRYYVPTIHPVLTPVDLMGYFDINQTRFILAQPYPKSEQLVNSNDAQIQVLIVGPEGGFSKQELQLFDRSSVYEMQLSDAILRIETACVSLLAKINHRQINQNGLL